VAADNGTARLLRNLGGGYFETVQLGSLPAAQGDAAFWADYDNDGFFDILTCGWAKMLKLHRNVASPQNPAEREFAEVTAQAGLSLPDSDLIIGPNWGDFDNDGDLDIFFPNYLGANLLFVNQGDGTFVSAEVGSPLNDGVRDFCGSWVDYDNDGFLDLFFVAGDGQPMPNFLYRNNLRNAGNQNHWLRVRLEGRASNRSAIGSVLRLRATIGGREVSQLRQITAKAGWESVSQSLAHFGLGDATKVDTLRIEWPSGIVQELQDVAVDQILQVVESQGLILPEPLSIQTCEMDATGVFHATVNCSVDGAVCVLESSSDLERWTKVRVGTSSGGTVELTDARAGESPGKFYRVLVP
jgi:enediyne biosynthesis protein E4